MLLAALAGFVLGCCATLLAWGRAEAQRQTAAVQAFGSAMAADMAHLAVEPLMRQDRIGLSLLASRIAERPQVRGIAVDTVDGRPFAVVGEPAGQDLPTFAAAVAVEDSVVGNVRVTLNPAPFALSLRNLLRASWWYWPIGLAVASGGGLLAVRRWRGDARASANTPLRHEAAASGAAVAGQSTAAAPADGALVLAANLFSRAGLAPAERDEALQRCLAAARAVARQHGGDAERLDRVGVAVTFPTTGPDAAYAALRGALVLRAAMARSAAPRFRYGLDRLASTVAEPASAVALLAALAADGELLLGASALASLEQPNRLRLTPIDDPALRPLSPVAQPSHLVQGVAAGEEAELAAQTAAVVAALG